MSFNTLEHGSISPGTVKVAGVEIRRKRIYCIVHGFYDLLMVSEEWFKRNHDQCNEPVRSEELQNEFIRL